MVDMNKMKVYHGSTKIINKPIYGYGKKYNDYGLGFYMTEDKEMAKEWSCEYNIDGFVNSYELDLEELNVLNLLDERYSILHWITILIEHRTLKIYTPIMKRAYDWLKRNYSISIEDYDVIIGYRADDSYFSFARAFLNNEISLEQLEKAMKLGNLGEQIVLKSPKAFSSLNYINFERVDSKKYYSLRSQRDFSARKEYFTMLEEDSNGNYIKDLIKEETKNASL